MGHAMRPKFVGDPEWIDPLLIRGATPEPVIVKQEDCDICGQVEKGCFGFGCSRTRRGVWSCFDPDCRAQAEARFKSDRRAA